MGGNRRTSTEAPCIQPWSSLQDEDSDFISKDELDRTSNISSFSLVFKTNFNFQGNFREIIKIHWKIWSLLFTKSQPWSHSLVLFPDMVTCPVFFFYVIDWVLIITFHFIQDTWDPLKTSHCAGSFSNIQKLKITWEGVFVLCSLTVFWILMSAVFTVKNVRSNVHC